MDRDGVERHLELAWRAFTPERGLRGRVRAQLAETGVVPLPPPRGFGGAVPRGWRALRASGKHGVGLGVALVAAGFLLGRVTTTGHVRESSPSPLALSSGDAASNASSPLPPAALPLPARLARPEPPASPSEESTPRPAARRPSAPPRAAPRPSAARDWRGELELLERAERGVRADNAALALALLQEHDARYPESVLIEERRAIELMAHCPERATDSSARAKRFLAEYPSSVYADRVIDLCEMDAAPSTEHPMKDRVGADIKVVKEAHVQPDAR